MITVEAVAIITYVTFAGAIYRAFLAVIYTTYNIPNRVKFIICNNYQEVIL